MCVRWRWPIQERGGGGRAPIYIGSYTRGNELTSKRACSWIVKRARESSTHELADRLSKHRQTFPGLARRLHSHICSTALVTVRCNESECELCITPVKHYKMYSAPFVKGSSRRCWELDCCLLLPAVCWIWGLLSVSTGLISRSVCACLDLASEQRDFARVQVIKTKCSASFVVLKLSL